MSDIIIISSLLLISWTFGRCALQVVKAENSLNDLSISIGLSVVIIVVNLLYFIGDFRISSIRLVLIVCFVVSVLYLAACFWRGSRFPAADLISSFLMYAVLILPVLIGGEQYYVFRGNWWDHFMYLSVAYGFTNCSLSGILDLNNNILLSNDLLVYVRDQYNLRPSVILLFSLFLSKGSGDIFLRGFLYNSAFLAAIYPPLKMIFRIIQMKTNSDKVPAWLLSLLPAGYIVGFWGQYIFDIQSWGQLASYSFLLSFIASYLILLNKWYSSGWIGNRPPVCNYVFSIILFSGSWFIYPENALFYLIMFAAASAAWLTLIRPPAKWRVIVWLVALPLFSLLFALPNYQTTIGLIIPQTVSAVTTLGKDWWQYFDSYLAGIDTDIESTVNTIMLTINKIYPLQNVISEFWPLPFYFIASIFGFYFITPQGELSLLYYSWQLLVITFAIAITIAFSRNILLKFRESTIPILFLRVSCMTGLMMTAYLAGKDQWWSAGKALSFTSPCLYILLLLPLVYFAPASDKGPLKHVAVAVAYTALVLSLGFGVARVYASLDENGIGYYRNYPSIQGKENKTDMLWKFDIEEARGCSGVNLDPISNPFLQHYVKLKLAYADIPYFTLQPVLTYLVVGDPIGTMPNIPTDCIISPYFDNKGRFAVSVRRMPRR